MQSMALEKQVNNWKKLNHITTKMNFYRYNITDLAKKLKACHIMMEK